MIPSLSIAACLLIVVYFLNNKYNLLFVLVVLSLIGNLFSVHILGVRMKFISIISLIIFFFFILGRLRFYQNNFKFKFYLKYELLLLLITGGLFTVFFPWESQFTDIVSFAQKLEMKALIGFTRILSDVMIVLSIPIILFKIKFKQNFLSKLFFSIILLQFIVSIIDFFTGYYLRQLLFDAPELLSDRFFGFNHEPRALGRNSLFAMIFMQHLYKSSNNIDIYAKLGRNVAFLSIIISFSLSTYIAFIIIFAITSLKSLKTLFVTVFSFALLFFVSVKIPYIKNNTIPKFNRIILEGKSGGTVFDGPEIFSHFEATNAAYLYFIWENPQHLLFGTGPNLINIAYEKYALINWQEDKNYFVSVAPTLGLFRLLARSGILGLVILLIFVFKLKKRILILSRNDVIRQSRLNLLYLSSLLLLMLYNQWFYFVLGYLVYETFSEFKKNRL